MCAKGEGGMSGELTAYMWIKLAAISDEDAQEFISSGEPKMSSTERAAGQRLVDDWLHRHAVNGDQRAGAAR
jgi:hypothetical protein